MLKGFLPSYLACLEKTTLFAEIEFIGNRLFGKLTRLKKWPDSAIEK